MFSDEEKNIKDSVVLAVANSYVHGYYLNPDFESLPTRIKDELKIMCVLYVNDVGGILILRFDKKGNLFFDVNSAEFDPGFDEIGSGLVMRKIQREKAELLESLELYYKAFFLGELDLLNGDENK